MMPGRSDQVYDELVVLRCQDGDPQAFEELVERWQGRLWQHARRLTDSRDEAWDALQEAWVAIVRGIGRLDDPALFRQWAYRIVTNKCADWTRRQVRRRRLDQEVAQDPSGTAILLPEARSKDDEIEYLCAVLETLPRDRRIILSLHYQEGATVAEIAGILGIPEGTVKSRLFHARNALRKALERNES